LVLLQHHQSVDHESWSEAAGAGGAAEPAAAVRELISLANSGGGPDNIACVVADLVESADLAVSPRRA
jgi:serine/threonine protein phosphatase PrpC